MNWRSLCRDLWHRKVSAILLSQGYLIQVYSFSLPSQLSPSSPQRPGKSGASGWAAWRMCVEWRRRSEQAACRRGGVSLTSQILYPRELKHLVVVRYVLKDANVLWTDFYFSLSICAYSTLASSVSLPASHCQAGALMSVPILQHKTHCVGYLCTVQYRI